MERKHDTQRAHHVDKPARDAPAVVSPELALQSQLGNRGLLALLAGSNIQRKAGGACGDDCECETCVQKKSAIAPSADPFELEADRIAESFGGAKVPAAFPSIQSKPRSAGGESAPVPQLGGGAALAAADRSYFEARFGHDFGDVRVHSDERAGKAAQSIDALAYTRGSDIVFAPAHYQPSTESGKKLIAHELTHVVQQRSAGERVQRAAVTAADVRISGVFDDGGGFDRSIFFDISSSTVPSSQFRKFPGLGSSTGPIVLHGFASEEGDAAFNTALIDRRIAAVRAMLIASPFSVDPTRITTVAHPGERAGEIEYRRWRVVEVQVGPDPAPPPGCAGQPTVQACDPTVFAATHSGALTAIDDARRLLIPGPGDPAVTAGTRRIVTQLFGTTPLADVAAGLQSIRDQLVAEVSLTPRTLASGGTQDRVICGTRCHELCRRGFDAVTNGTGADSQITLCPTFFAGGRGDVPLLVHETSHATERMSPFADPAGGGTSDFAYFHDRLMTRLDRLGLENGTTYQALLIMLGGGTLSLGPGVTDVDAFPPSRTSDRDTAMTVVAQAERWAEATAADISFAYGEMNGAISRPGVAATTPIDATGWNADTIRDLDTQFTIHNPGQDPITSPADENMWRMAGIRDRYQHVFDLFRVALTFAPRSTGGVVWIGDTIQFGPDFFSAAPADRVRMVLRRGMARLSLDPRGALRAGLVSSYIDFASSIASRRGLPP